MGMQDWHLGHSHNLPVIPIDPPLSRIKLRSPVIAARSALSGPAGRPSKAICVTRVSVDGNGARLPDCSSNPTPMSSRISVAKQNRGFGAAFL